MLFVCTRVVSSGGDTVEESCMPPEFTSLQPEVTSSEGDSNGSSLPNVFSSESSVESQNEVSTSSSSDPDLVFIVHRNSSVEDNQANRKSDGDNHERDRDNDNHDTIVNVFVNNQIITNTNSSDVKESNANANETKNSTIDQRDISENNENPDVVNVDPETQRVGNDSDASSSGAPNNAPSGRPSKNKRLKSGRDNKKTENGDVDDRSDLESAGNATSSSSTTNSTESAIAPLNATDVTMPSSTVGDDLPTSQSPDKNPATAEEQNCDEINEKSLPVFHSVLSNSTEEQSRCIDLLVGIDLELLTPELLVLNLSVDYNRCVDAILDQYSHLLVLLSDILGIPVDDVIELAYDLIAGKTVDNGPESCVADEFEQNTSALQKILDNLLNILKTVVLNLKVDLKLLGLDLKVDVMVLKYSKLLEVNLELNVPALEKTVKSLLGEKALENETLRKLQAKGNVHKLLGNEGLM